jgi:hypothetical protein
MTNEWDRERQHQAALSEEDSQQVAIGGLRQNLNRDEPIIRRFDERHIEVARAHDMSPDDLLNWQEATQRIIYGS